MSNDSLQGTPGRLTPCCGGIKWALSCGYIKKGYPWYVNNKRSWIPWTLNVTGEGFKDISPIAFCPFSGHNLNEPED